MSSLSNNHEKLSLHLSTIPDIFIHWILYRPAFFHLRIFSILAFFLFLHFFYPCNLYPLIFFSPSIFSILSFFIFAFFLFLHFFHSCLFSIPAICIHCIFSLPASFYPRIFSILAFFLSLHLFIHCIFLSPSISWLFFDCIFLSSHFLIFIPGICILAIISLHFLYFCNFYPCALHTFIFLAVAPAQPAAPCSQ